MTQQKHVCIINTGGTIGMRPSANGFVPAKGFLTEQLDALSELSHPDMPTYDIIEFDPLIDSANATPVFWNRIAQTIEQYYVQYDGFVVLHGTDTMTYAASALSFMLENLSKPVLLTGAQVPIAQIPSDARNNVIDALYLTSHYNINEVCIYFSNTLYRGNRATKKSAVSFEAFATPNYPVLGDVSAAVHVHESRLLAKPVDQFSLVEFCLAQLGVVQLFPGISANWVQQIIQQPLQALVLQSYGSGNAPNDRALLDIIQTAVDQGVVVVNCTQCLHGGVKADAYATGSALTQVGVVSALDMTVEATVTKLIYLLSQQLSITEIKSQLQENLRGEISSSLARGKS